MPTPVDYFPLLVFGDYHSVGRYFIWLLARNPAPLRSPIWLPVRGIVQQLVGQRFMGKVDSLAANYLENNPFLVAGFLMTGLFDFVCYAVGLMF